MALQKLPYRTLVPLVRHYLSTDDDDTVDLIRGLRPARARGYLSPSDLEKVCCWKSPRALHYNQEQQCRSCP